MSVRTPALKPSTQTQRQRQRKPQLWDSLTVGLAIAVVLLGFVIFLFPKTEAPAQTPTKHLPTNMAQVNAPTSLSSAA